MSWLPLLGQQPPDASLFSEFGPWGICLVLLLFYALDQRAQNKASQAEIRDLNKQMTTDVVPTLVEAVSALRAVESSTRGST